MDALAGYGSSDSSDSSQDQEELVVVKSSETKQADAKPAGAASTRDDVSCLDDPKTKGTTKTSSSPQKKRARRNGDFTCDDSFLAKYRLPQPSLISSSSSSQSMVLRNANYLSTSSLSSKSNNNGTEQRPQQQQRQLKLEFINNNDVDVNTIIQNHKSYANYLKHQSDFDNPVWDLSNNR